MVAANVIYLPTPAPAPERQIPAPTVGVRLIRDANAPSGWSRKRIGEPEVELARRGGVPVLTSWDQLDLTSPLFADGAVVLDRVSL